ncbi:hypothetical protein [Actinocrispum wychmicini]|uniref:hypothetical protein n=1 Tax=Actinocrispum wychmicini TaxID=1213861 RepID=UPI001049EAE0|nr:hypothetical protein [Actinocrispum wychmicini]
MTDASGSQAAAGPTTVSTSSPASPATATWGKRYTWPDGLAIEVAQPKSCTPSKNAYPPGVKRGVIVSITVINGTKQAFDAGMLGMGSDRQFAGHPADSVGDSGGPCKAGTFVAGTVLPGKTLTYTESYAVDATPGELQLAFQPSFGAEKVFFVGQA